jgi:LytR cell envelope-related transcriptional attenuator
MTALLAALSLQAKIEQYGAYAGIAAVFGLGVLSLLYFAQAREVKRLREWAGRAPERAAELEARVTADAERRLSDEPAAAPAAAPATAAATAAGAMAATPAAAGSRIAAAAGATARLAPAAAGAVRAAGATAAVAAGRPSTVVAPAAAPAQGNGAGAAPPAPAGPPPVAPARPNGQPTASPAPAPRPQPAPAAQKPAPRPSGLPAPAAAGAAAAGAAARPAPAKSAPLRLPSQTAGIPRPPAGARPRTGSPDRSPGRVAAIVGAVVGVAVLAVVVAVVVFGVGSSDNNTPAPSANTVARPGSSGGGGGSGKPAPKAPAKVDRSQFTVAVLNGTTVTGVARAASDKVTGRGFQQGVVTNDPTNQARQVTEIFYEPKGRPAALDVARILGVRAANVKAMDQSSRLAADGAQVAVFIGADKAQ